MIVDILFIDFKKLQIDLIRDNILMESGMHVLILSNVRPQRGGIYSGPSLRSQTVCLVFDSTCCLSTRSAVLRLRSSKLCGKDESPDFFFFHEQMGKK